VTIAACLKFDDGVLFCADTKITTDIKTNQTKIFPNAYGGDSYCATVFVIAGSVPYARASILECENRIAKLDFLTVPMEEIRREIEIALVDFYQKHIYPNPDKYATEFRLLAGVWLRGEMQMFSSYMTTVTPVPDYECIGAGAYLAKYWIRKFFSSEERGPHREPRTLEDVGLISAYALKSVMEYDESCGGEAEFLVMRANGEIGFDVDARIYPCEQLPDRFLNSMWRTLRKLVRADNAIDADLIIYDFEVNVREIGKVRMDWIEMLNSSLKKSIEPAHSAAVAPESTAEKKDSPEISA